MCIYFNIRKVDIENYRLEDSLIYLYSDHQASSNYVGKPCLKK